MKIDYSNPTHSKFKAYIVKAVYEEGLFIYELNLKGKVIKINVYAMENILKMLPR